MTSKPNIVFVHTDSMDGRVMGCMGHPAMRRATPNLDRLAQRGVLYRNFYSNNPICCPSRASMLSGQYTFHCEAWNNYKGLDDDEPNLFTHFDEEGYRVQIYGKTDYLNGAHTIRARVTAWTRSANIMRPAYKEGPPRILESNEKRVHARDWQDVDSAVCWLREEAPKEDSPFLLYVGIRAPHPAFLTSRYYLRLIDESSVDIPPEDEGSHPVIEYQRISKNWQHGFSAEMVRLVRRVYFAMVAEVDAMVGEIMAVLDEMGLTDATYFVFSSDHGEMAMEHRLWYKSCAYEASVRVPLIIAGPGMRQGVVIEKPASLVDLYPTFLDMAGLSHPAGLDGHSLWLELMGQESDRPDWVLSEYHDSAANTGIFMLRRGDWKYVAYPGYPPQLFNLAEDPDEILNLAPVRPDVVGEMDTLLRSIVDYEAVDAKVKAYDRRAFRRWRLEQKSAGTYEELMARVYSGWDDLAEDEIRPWTETDERQIVEWLSR